MLGILGTGILCGSAAYTACPLFFLIFFRPDSLQKTIDACCPVCYFTAGEPGMTKPCPAPEDPGRYEITTGALDANHVIVGIES